MKKYFFLFLLCFSSLSNNAFSKNCDIRNKIIKEIESLKKTGAFDLLSFKLGDVALENNIGSQKVLEILGVLTIIPRNEEFGDIGKIKQWAFSYKLDGDNCEPLPEALSPLTDVEI